MTKNLLQGLYSEIKELGKFTPSDKVNSLFNRLVSYALDENSKLDLTPKELFSLQSLCSKAEYELEKYWAKKIIKSSSPKKTLREFPYYNNYEKLTQLEWYSLLSCSSHKNHKIIFIGGGPLPLTSIILAERYADKVVVLDKNKEAYNLATTVIKKLKLRKKIKVKNNDASKFNAYNKFNVIIIAALAGVSKSVKKKILIKIKEDSLKGAHIVARSSWGMRKILYRPLDKEFQNLFKPMVEVRPQNEVVNSIVIFSKG